MTNREKFKEAFGFDIPKNEHFFCTMVDDNECKKHSTCDKKCPGFDWWDKEYDAPITSQIKASMLAYIPSVDSFPSTKDIYEQRIELKGIVKVLRFAESKMGIPFDYEDKVIVKEMIKFCADDIEEIIGGKKK